MSNIFVVTDNAASIGANTQTLMTWLAGLGHNVSARSDTDPVEPDENFDLLVTSNVNKAEFATKYKFSQNPILVADPGPWVDYGLLTSTFSGNGASKTTQSIETPSHPAAGGLTGEVTIRTVAQQAKQSPNWVADGVTIVADSPGSTSRTVVAFEAGSTYHTGEQMPARRIGYGIFQDYANYTPDGETLLAASVSWLLESVAVEPSMTFHAYLNGAYRTALSVNVLS